MFLGLSLSGGPALLILTVHGCLGTGWESIYCNQRTWRACPRRLKLIQRIIISLSREKRMTLAQLLGKFWCESMGAVEKKLKEMEISYVRSMVEEGGIHVDQLFFHDPDGFMVEICDCDNLPVIPLAGEMARSCSRLNVQMVQHQQQIRVIQQ
ncbi:uncharacterized protein LOC115988634 isoform X2 [Quercus lobata]|uniref:uncharacterized protein LOC115988634 isoform X2 n=1 Tax=Quercus lobata TaxID=97700 RepID=UPI001244576F|nr:uncharacterized protein LOC115988634 isoform X2 [Quercus lobata]